MIVDPGIEVNGGKVRRPITSTAGQTERSTNRSPTPAASQSSFSRSFGRWLTAISAARFRPSLVPRLSWDNQSSPSASWKTVRRTSRIRRSRSGMRIAGVSDIYPCHQSMGFDGGVEITVLSESARSANCFWMSNIVSAKIIMRTICT
jgi:hypothetical protein